MDLEAAGAITAVALALVVAVAVAARRRGGIVITVRLWWDGRDRGDETGTPPSQDPPVTP